MRPPPVKSSSIYVEFDPMSAKRLNWALCSSENVYLYQAMVSGIKTETWCYQAINRALNSAMVYGQQAIHLALPKNDYPSRTARVGRRDRRAGKFVSGAHTAANNMPTYGAGDQAPSTYFSVGPAVTSYGNNYSLGLKRLRNGVWVEQIASDLSYKFSKFMGVKNRNDNLPLEGKYCSTTKMIHTGLNKRNIIYWHMLQHYADYWLQHKLINFPLYRQNWYLRMRTLSQQMYVHLNVIPSMNFGFQKGERMEIAESAIMKDPIGR